MQEANQEGEQGRQGGYRYADGLEAIGTLLILVPAMLPLIVKMRYGVHVFLTTVSMVGGFWMFYMVISIYLKRGRSLGNLKRRILVYCYFTEGVEDRWHRFTFTEYIWSNFSSKTVLLRCGRTRKYQLRSTHYLGRVEYFCPHCHPETRTQVSGPPSSPDCAVSGPSSSPYCAVSGP